MGNASPRADIPENAIAVIGMAGRFPGARSVDQFWDNLCAGREGIRTFAPGEIDPSVPARDRNDPNYVFARGIVDDFDRFDAAFFGVSPLEAEVMDPQQRILLEVAWAALENAGYAPGGMAESVGVYAGMNWNRYRTHCVAAHPEKIAQFGEFKTALANEYDFLATRISYKLNLRGPSVTVGTACSTSLVAIAQAAQALLNYDCDFALAGGASITVPVLAGYLHQEENMLSADGHCRAFDAKGTGTVFSDGAAMVVLRRLRDAIDAGDRIDAVVRGFAVNNDGSEKVSFTAPGVNGQADVIRSAWDYAEIDPGTIGYVEAHGTATPLGDPIEVAALKRVFTPDRMRGTRCALGSVKSSVGHLIHAAGVAGFIKAALAVSKGKIPPTLYFESPNPRLGLDDSPFSVNASLKEWERTSHPRRAGVSSFGVGGTNAHVVVEEPPAVEPSSPADGPQLLRLSARTPTSLNAAASRLADHLEKNPAFNLADVAHTLDRGRGRFAFRLAVAADSAADAVRELRVPRDAARANAASPPNLVWVFPGQGAQYAGMGRGLYERDPAFRTAFDDALKAFEPAVDFDLRARMFGDGEDTLRSTGTTQPAIFCLEYALARAWLARGAVPTALIGHSVGEFVAAVLAGVMTLPDAARLVAYRGAILERLPAGSMLSVRLPADALTSRLTEGLSVAAVNGPSSCVVSGPSPAVNAFSERLERDGIANRILRTSHAFHSAMMDPAIAPFESEVSRVALSAPRIPIVSTLTGRWLGDRQATDAKYWSRHLRETVQFSAAIRTALGRDADAAFLEIGPRATLSTLIRQHVAPGQPAPVSVPSLADSPDTESLQFVRARGQLWAMGIELSTPATSTPERRLRVALPSYAFDPTRYWLDAAPAKTAPAPENRVPAPDSPGDSGSPTQTGTSPTVDKIRGVFEDLSGLDLSAVGTHVRFVELGFDSLTLTQAAQQLKRTFGVNVKFRQLMEGQSTFESLARFLEPGSPPAASPVLVPSESEPLPTRSPPAPAGPEAESRVGYDVKKAFGAIARIHTKSGEITERQRFCLNAFVRQYTEKTKASKAYTVAHRSHTADPRVVNGFRPVCKEITYQIVIDRSRGSRLWDLDGNEYVDVLNGFGMNLFGWRPDFINRALHEQLDRGYEIGPQHALTGVVSKLLCELTGFDRAALCNTGSEAVMAAVRIARTVTGRDTVVLFTGSYHGTFDEVLVRAGRNAKGLPAAPGIMAGMFGDVRVLDYGTPESLEYIRTHARDLAAVLVEPVQSRRPDFQPRDFLREVRAITAESGTCLIFDEVITGFRADLGGVQALFDVRADLATYGKVIGGGLPIGAVAGTRAYMDALDGGSWNYGDGSIPTVGVTYFAGTFVRHPLALAAARASLEHLKREGPDLQRQLNATTAAMAHELNAYCRDVGAPVEIRHFASLWRIAWREDHPLQDLLFAMMRCRGVHILDNFPCFLTTAHTAQDIESIARAFRDSVSELQNAGFLPKRAIPVAAFDATRPPRPGARLGRDSDGKPAWFVADPIASGQFHKVTCP